MTNISGYLFSEKSFEGSSMNPRNALKTHPAHIAAACIAMLLVVPMFWAQETKEKITVDDVDRTFTVRLPRGFDFAAPLSGRDPAARHESGCGRHGAAYPV
jgi:hypothetical protein